MFMLELDWNERPELSHLLVIFLAPALKVKWVNLLDIYWACALQRIGQDKARPDCLSYNIVKWLIPANLKLDKNLHPILFLEHESLRAVTKWVCDVSLSCDLRLVDLILCVIWGWLWQPYYADHCALGDSHGRILWSCLLPRATLSCFQSIL